MDELDRKAADLAEANRRRRNRVPPLVIVGMVIALAVMLAARCWPMLPG